MSPILGKAVTDGADSRCGKGVVRADTEVATTRVAAVRVVMEEAISRATRGTINRARRTACARRHNAMAVDISSRHAAMATARQCSRHTR